VDVRARKVEVEWLDARSIYEEILIAKVAERVTLVRRFSLGYMVYKDKERIVLAGTFDPVEDGDKDGDGGADYTCIPTSWVIKIAELRTTEDADAK
jgi:hypothetical protein